MSCTVASKLYHIEFINMEPYVPRAAVKRGEMVSLICEEAACVLNTLKKALLERVRLLHELKEDKSLLLWEDD